MKFPSPQVGITPLLRTANPKAKDQPGPLDEVVGWAFERPNQGRSFCFTGAHLHESFAEEGYRRWLVNGILWSAKVELPPEGAPVNLDSADLPKYLTPKKK